MPKVVWSWRLSERRKKKKASSASVEFAKRAISRRIRLLSAAGCVVLVLALLPNGKTERAALVSAPSVIQERTVILDAGHGGFDGGAIAADGTSEKDINLHITLQLGEYLRLCGYRVVYTRTEDTATDTIPGASVSRRKVDDMKQRLSFMKENPDAVFISIHLNKFTAGNVSGTQVFYSDRVLQSKILGQCIQNAVVRQLQPENTRSSKKEGRNTYLSRNATVPFAIVECGFLSNTRELALLKQPEYQDELAYCIFGGILDYFSAQSGF